VFEILLARIEAHEPIEPTALLALLAAVPGAGVEWLAKLLEIAAVPSSVGYYAEIVPSESNARGDPDGEPESGQQVRELDDDAGHARGGQRGVPVDAQRRGNAVARVRAWSMISATSWTARESDPVRRDPLARSRPRDRRMGRRPAVRHRR